MRSKSTTSGRAYADSIVNNRDVVRVINTEKEQTMNPP